MRIHVTVLAALTFVSSACAQNDFSGQATRGDDVGGEGDGASADDGRPGDDARADDDDVSCEIDDDCRHGESCEDGVCQMPRCQDGPYLSAAPLGAGLRFSVDREFVVADSVAFEGAYYVDGYAPEPGTLDYPGSWNAGSDAIVDVAGGDFFAQGPETFAVAITGSSIVTVGSGESATTFDVGFAPVAVAAGDANRDHRDELLALGQFGNLALCDIASAACTSFAIQNANARDAAFADVDGDGFAEPVLLLEQSGNALIYVWNVDDGTTEQDDVSADAGHDLTRIAAGDLDGDGTAEILGFVDDGFISAAQLVTYRANAGAIVETSAQDVDDTSRDLTLVDIDRDRREEVLVLRENGIVELLRAAGDTGALMSVETDQLSVSVDPIRIAGTDFDGDSPRSRLVDAEGALVSGPIVPSMVIHFPPYDGQHSRSTSSVAVGERESTNERLTDSVSLAANVDLGVSASLFDLFKVSLSTSVSAEVTAMTATGTTISVGDRHTAQPDPSLFGRSYGEVVLSCGCFHAYYYEVEDPAGHLDDSADGEQFVLLLPVGGTTTVWSTPRYNAMAAAVGGLPIVDIPYQIGDPGSYPRGPQRADGSPIDDDDFVFPEVPNYLVSDVSNIGWQLAVGKDETNGVSTKTGIKVSGSLGVAGFQFGAGLGESWGHAYQITVGTEAQFGGSVPPIPDDPATPEDEYLENAFSFAPYVYREHYVDAEGNDAAYYVMSYAVSDE